MWRAVLAAGLMPLLPLFAQTQSITDSQRFEAASIKPVKAQSRHYMTGGPGTDDPGFMRCYNMSLLELVQNAYDVKYYQLQGTSAWMESERFDVIAKVPKGATKEEAKAMLQHLLEDRFKLVQHRESRLVPVYDLVVAKGGAKLMPSKEESKPVRGGIDVDDKGDVVIPKGPLGRPVTLAARRLVTFLSASRVYFVAKSQPVSALAEALGLYAERPVRDATGLIGNYDFSLGFAPTPRAREMVQGFALGPEGECVTCTQNEEPLADLLAALREQLGLRFEPATGPLELLIIEHVEKVPTEN
jgi:uncharacterized protein (TIGR03435 family)